MATWVESSQFSKVMDAIKAKLATKLGASEIKNNATTQESGFVLDARMGKTLGDRTTALEDSAKKLTAALKQVAYTGSYSDLTGVPDTEVDLRILDFEGSTTTFLTDGSIAELFADGRSIKTEFASDGSIVEKLYATNGVTVLKTKTTTFNDDGSISAVVA